MTAIVVIAKECVPGKVKTRLHPPYSFEEAAQIASAALTDTMDAVRHSAWSRRILFFTGTPPASAAGGWEVMPQPEGTLDERLAHLFDALDEPAVLLGMDTPHFDAGVLADYALAWPDDVDALFGPALDGGFWALGMSAPDGALIRGVTMSLSTTGDEQLARLHAAGLRVARLPALGDIDTAADLEPALARAPRLSEVVGRLGLRQQPA